MELPGVPYVIVDVWDDMAIPVGILGALVMAVALLPLTASTFFYALVEQAHRSAWTRAPQSPHLGSGPYRRTQLPVVRMRRAPWLVRAAALACFYWSWFSVGVWVVVGLALRATALLEVVAIAGILVAVWTGRAGGKLLRRDDRLVKAGRRAAVATAVHVGLVTVLARALGGEDLGGPAMVFGGLSLGQTFLLVAALRRHQDLFGGAEPRPGSPGRSIVAHAG